MAWWFLYSGKLWENAERYCFQCCVERKCEHQYIILLAGRKLFKFKIYIFILMIIYIIRYIIRYFLISFNISWSFLETLYKNKIKQYIINILKAKYFTYITKHYNKYIYNKSIYANKKLLTAYYNIRKIYVHITIIIM